jgi:hypothetical protein
VSVDREFSIAPRSGIPSGAFASNISGERCFFDPSMNSRFLERFECGRLGVGQGRFSATFGKSPSSPSASLDQQELNAIITNAVADRRNLFAIGQFAKLRQPDKPGC